MRCVGDVLRNVRVRVYDSQYLRMRASGPRLAVGGVNPRVMAATESDRESGSSSSEEEEELLLLLLAMKSKERRKKKEKVAWVRPIFAKRKQQGEYHNLLQEMRLVDPQSHFAYLRMSKEQFDHLLSKVCLNCLQPAVVLQTCIVIITVIVMYTCRLVHSSLTVGTKVQSEQRYLLLRD